MDFIKVIALIVFAISCMTIYHSTNSFEPRKRIIYIIIGMAIMFGIVSIMCAMKSDLIKTTDETLINNALTVIKIFITPINAIILLVPLGRTLCKAYDEVITTGSATKRIGILLVAFFIVLIFELGYIGNFISNLLGHEIIK